MGESTKIQWADHTFNPWRGCTKVAPGCANCYADAQSKRNPKTLGIWGPNGTRVVASEAMWREPLKWERDAETTAEAWPEDRPRVFCASLADVFEDWQGEVRNARGEVVHRCRAGHSFGMESVYAYGCECVSGCNRAAMPMTLDDVRARLFRLIDATPSLDWLLLTKRPENIREKWPSECTAPTSAKPVVSRSNVWLGASISCQEDAERNIPELLACRDLAARLFVSVEPLIESVDLEKIASPEAGKYASALHREHDDRFFQLQGAPLDWVIVGGESGPHARPCDIAWIRSIVRQCRDAEVPVFVKQLGAYCLDNDARSRRAWPLAVPMTLRDDCTRMIYRDPKGGDPAEWPEDVRVREVPDGKGGER